MTRDAQGLVPSGGELVLYQTEDGRTRMFSSWYNVPIRGEGKAMPNVTAEGITLINFGMGSPNAATVMDLLGAVRPKACLLLGKCGGLKKKSNLGALILPIAAIRGEGTSNDYFPPEVPALPAFNLQKAVSTTIRNHHHDYWTGTVYTTNRRVWEHDEKQGLPAGNPRHGDRHGDGHPVHHQLLQ